MEVIRISKENAAETARRIRSEAESRAQIWDTVREIVEAVRRRGDEALIELAEKFDGVKLRKSELLSTVEEAKEASKSIPSDLLSALKSLRRRLMTHERRIYGRLFMNVNAGGCHIEIRPIPLEAVGCYAPGGAASYPSSVLMMGVPGLVAGVERLVLATPPRKREDDRRMILAAAYTAGFSEILWSGGAQAVAALAYGTETVKGVQKVVGPGNRYVLEAKRLVSKDVAVDFTAGPTELLVILDSASPFRQAALEMAAQAEHSPDTLVGAVVLDEDSETALMRSLSEVLLELPKDSSAKQSLETRGFVCIADDWDAAARFANTLAPEHLLVYAKLGKRKLKDIRHAGVISHGPNASSVFLDYYAGPNHVLPTDGWASIRGGLTVLDYVKLLPSVKPTKRVLRRAYGEVRVLIEAEGLPLHLKAFERAARIESS